MTFVAYISNSFYRTIQLCRMAVKNEHRGNALQLGIMSSSSSSSSCHQPVHACGNRGTQIKRQILWHKIWILNTDPLCMSQVATVGTATHMHASGRSWAATTYSGFICGTYPYVVTTGARSLIWIKLPANHTIEILYFTDSARNLPHRLSFCLT